MTSIPTEVPIQEQPITEVSVEAGAEAIQAVFKRMMEHDIPGFVIRAAEGVSVSDMQHVAQDAATIAHGKEHEIMSDIPFVVNAVQGRDSGLHADSEPSEDEQHYHVHTTAAGKAKVALANSRSGAKGINARYDKRLRELEAQNLTDAGIMDPEMHTGEVAKNDTVIFRVSGPNPTFHKFDTLEERHSQVAVLAPKVEKTVIEDNDRD